MSTLVSQWYLGTLQHVPEGCQEVVWKVFYGCLQGIKLSRNFQAFFLGEDRSKPVWARKKGHVRTGQVREDTVGHDRLGQG